ncbi:TPA: hypothetical protein ACPFIV_001873 [Klebsiella michiganensis]
MTDITELTPEAARESGSILIIVAARMARREFFTPLHALCESGQRVVSTRALCDAVERAEEHMVSQVSKIVDGHDRLTKKLKEAESRNAELVEALEKAQRANAAQDDHINQQKDRIEQLERGNRYAAKRISSWRRLAKQSIAEQEKCVNELDAARQRIVELDRKNSELDSLTQRWAVERAENAERIAELEESHAQVIQSRDHYKRMTEEGLKQLAESRTVKLPKKNIGWDREEDDCWNNAIDACAEALAAAGIKWEDE